MGEKLKWLLDNQFNQFHADLIWNALHDEFVPEEFKNLA